MASGRPADMAWLFLRASGRIGRQLFVLGWLFLTAINGFFLGILFAQEEGSDALAAWSTVALFAGAFAVWASAMLTVKRLHDIDKPGIFAVLIFVPMISILLLLVLAILPGTAGRNTYGDMPNAPRH